MTWISIFSVIRGARPLVPLFEGATTRRLLPGKHGYSGGMAALEAWPLGGRHLESTELGAPGIREDASRSGIREDTSHSGKLSGGCESLGGAGHLRVRGIRRVREHGQSRGSGRSEGKPSGGRVSGGHGHPKMQDIKRRRPSGGRGSEAERPPQPPKPKLAYDLRLPPYAACLRLP